MMNEMQRMIIWVEVFMGVILCNLKFTCFAGPPLDLYL